MSDLKLREDVCRLAQALYDRGLTHGSTGNISVRTDHGWLVTPTGSCLGHLDPGRLSLMDWNGNHVSGDKPSKESFLHLAMYQERERNAAVVHLHSIHAVAASVLADVDVDNALPPLTAYYVMRIGTLPLVPYYAPGDQALPDAVRGFAGKHHALLLANHGPVVAGSSLSAAVDAIEELEATAKLHLLLHGRRTCPLNHAQCEELHRRYPA
jgi:3-dehydro-4-phosphotetronate decarboxylase